MDDLEKISVVVADDDSILRELLKAILHSEKRFKVIGEASNGLDAVALCAKLKPVLVLLDINMPRMDGLQALEEIRKINPATRVIMISAEATMDSVSQAIKKGALGFVVKPMNAATVIDKIENCLKKRG